jgi:hypothetical protein
VEHCPEHQGVETTLKYVVKTLDEIKVAILGDITNEESYGLVSRLRDLEKRVVELEGNRTTVMQIVARVIPWVLLTLFALVGSAATLWHGGLHGGTP